jgi:hypothetical protein
VLPISAATSCRSSPAVGGKLEGAVKQPVFGESDRRYLGHIPVVDPAKARVA